MKVARARVGVRVRIRVRVRPAWQHRSPAAPPPSDGPAGPGLLRALKRRARAAQTTLRPEALWCHRASAPEIVLDCVWYGATA